MVTTRTNVQHPPPPPTGGDDRGGDAFEEVRVEDAQTDTPMERNNLEVAQPRVVRGEHVHDTALVAILTRMQEMETRLLAQRDMDVQRIQMLEDLLRRSAKVNSPPDNEGRGDTHESPHPTREEEARRRRVKEEVIAISVIETSITPG